jgi:uncharacterized protein with HEPN domain
MKDDRLYLDHILNRIERIERFTAEGHEAFLASDLIQDAVLRCFEVMGSPSVKSLTICVGSILILPGDR